MARRRCCGAQRRCSVESKRIAIREGGGAEVKGYAGLVQLKPSFRISKLTFFICESSVPATGVFKGPIQLIE